MHRRHFLSSLAGLPLSVAAYKASAQVCNVTPFAPPACQAGINLQQFQYAAQQQFLAQWCWAACISMIFGHHGFPVSQARIVSEVYGSLENKPAMGWVIASQLNRPWIDDRGRRFVARLGPVYDRHAGQNNLDNHQIVSELSAGRPLVLGAGGHAVVLTRLEYQTMPPGLNVTGGTVFDPWPGRGLRPLSWNELVPGYLGGGLHFLATVQCVRV